MALARASKKVISKMVPVQKITHTKDRLITETTASKTVTETLFLDGKERLLPFPYPRNKVATVAFLRSDGEAVVTLHKCEIKTDLERTDRSLTSEDELLYEIRILRGDREAKCTQDTSNMRVLYYVKRYFRHVDMPELEPKTDGEGLSSAPADEQKRSRTKSERKIPDAVMGTPISLAPLSSNDSLLYPRGRSSAQLLAERDGTVSAAAQAQLAKLDAEVLAKSTRTMRKVDSLLLLVFLAVAVACLAMKIGPSVGALQQHRFSTQTLLSLLGLRGQAP